MSCHTNSGCIGINFTRNQDTAVPFPYNSGAQETALPCPLYHCGVAGIDINNQETAVPCPYNSILGRDTALPCPLSCPRVQRELI